MTYEVFRRKTNEHVGTVEVQGEWSDPAIMAVWQVGRKVEPTMHFMKLFANFCCVPVVNGIQE